MSEHDETPMCVIVFPVACINDDLCRQLHLSQEELIRSQLEPVLTSGDPTHLGQGNAVAEESITITLG